jgi:hypothetical protein
MYLDQLQEKVSQGDIFDGLPLSHVAWGTPPHSSLRYVRAILLTYDCEYDKPNCKFVPVAEVKPLSLVPENGRGNVRKNHVARSFYLQPQGGLEESYVDFRHVGVLDKRIVEDAFVGGRRIFSLDEDSVLALQEQLYGFLGYERKG